MKKEVVFKQSGYEATKARMPKYYQSFRSESFITEKDRPRIKNWKKIYENELY